MSPEQPIQSIAIHEGGVVLQLVLQELRALKTAQQAEFAESRSAFDRRLEQLVTKEAFMAEQRRVDRQHEELRQDILDEASARLGYQAAMGKRADDQQRNLRWLIGVVAAGLFAIIPTFVSVWGS